MSTTWCSYRARWQGMEYPCTLDQHSDSLWVHLRSTQPLDEFEELDSGIYLRLVNAAECDMVAHITMVCQWRGEPCLVMDERDDELLLEYTGGQVPRALALGLKRIERGVYRGWVQRDEVRGLRENTTLLVPPKN
ncbi:MAG: hypothetical protein H0U22_08350 [Geodermatophilaceae bacterium]|nr:hypothetical protein [Geodermatophilaceae bacterium]